MLLIDTLLSGMYVILFTLIMVASIVAVATFYFLKIKKVAAVEEKVNYDSFRREDATEYAKFSDIISSGEEHDKSAMGMISVGNNVFVGGIEVSGYNYHSASAEEKQRTMINTIGFFNTVESPIQMRQTVQAIDITQNIEQEKKLAKELAKELVLIEQDMKACVEKLEASIEDDRAYYALMDKYDQMSKKHGSKQWMLKEAESMIEYMQAVSNVNNNTRKINQIMFSYTYNPDDDLEELTKEEILLKAERELSALGAIYGGGLESAGCTWRMLTADDLTNLMRRHFHPDTVDSVRLDELLNSSYNALYISTDSLEELEIEKRGELAYQQNIERNEQEFNERIANARKKFKEATMEAANQAASM